MQRIGFIGLGIGFRIDLHHKDMGIAQVSARAAGVALPVTGQLAQLVAAQHRLNQSSGHRGGRTRRRV